MVEICGRNLWLKFVAEIRADLGVRSALSFREIVHVSVLTHLERTSCNLVVVCPVAAVGVGAASGVVTSGVGSARVRAGAGAAAAV